MSFSSAKNGKLDDKLVPYDDALAIVCDTAREHARCREYRAIMPPCTQMRRPLAGFDQLASRCSKIALIDALDRRSAVTILTPCSTPQHDTSAMDGYAVCSSSTMTASDENPLRLQVVDTIAAGGSPSSKRCEDIAFAESTNICVEIMTRARFSEKSMPFLDSVIKVKDVVVGEDCSEDGSIVSRYILLRKPVNHFQHKRPAGSDFGRGAVIIKGGKVIRPQHIAALATLGIVDIEVFDDIDMTVTKHPTSALGRQLRIGILSTGSEIIDPSKQNLPAKCDILDKQNVPDSNGPYLVSSLMNACPSAEIMHLGIAGANEDALTQKLMTAIAMDDLDVIITSGGVSRGRYDLVRGVAETRLRDQVRFHGVKIRPGAPVLFATMDAQSARRTNPSRRRIAFFGAPGNPLAAAVTLRFFVLPYVFTLTFHSGRGQQLPREIEGRDVGSPESQLMASGPSIKRAWLTTCRRKPGDTTVFWLAKRSTGDARTVDILDDQASYKLSGILEADFWVMIPAGVGEVHHSDELMAYPL
ncbi:hypothetical protein LTR70_010640 [Exophiala xenobiotica]|uniref:molybdopterin adenylyltransferase n=1 Tax=Lithohypha guttulata TaxID=1690604 RepID=A0ABR0JTG6_9EURO|nr:hypothetical protein LTR24_010593 [Lithohypha guttulata]KAK5309060.1 hypothetical protein LTR70_010640 [Exophiala xenobiotica]